MELCDLISYDGIPSDMHSRGSPLYKFSDATEISESLTCAE